MAMPAAVRKYDMQSRVWLNKSCPDRPHAAYTIVLLNCYAGLWMAGMSYACNSCSMLNRHLVKHE